MEIQFELKLTFIPRISEIFQTALLHVVSKYLLGLVAYLRKRDFMLKMPLAGQGDGQRQDSLALQYTSRPNNPVVDVMELFWWKSRFPLNKEIEKSLF